MVSVGLMRSLTYGALAMAALACHSPAWMLYAAESRELVHAKNKTTIANAVKSDPDDCEPVTDGEELCTWTYRPWPIGDMTYFLRCRLPIDGSSREPRSCVLTLPVPDGRTIREPEYY